MLCAFLHIIPIYSDRQSNMMMMIELPADDFNDCINPAIIIIVETN